MVLTINGKEETVEGSDLTVTGLLQVKAISMPDMVSVQLNGNILKRDTFDTTFVRANDQVNFLYFMGGG